MQQNKNKKNLADGFMDLTAITKGKVGSETERLGNLVCLLHLYPAHLTDKATLGGLHFHI